MQVFCKDKMVIIPKQSMYGIFPYIYHKNQPNVGKYTIHGWYGIYVTILCNAILYYALTHYYIIPFQLQ